MNYVYLLKAKELKSHQKPTGWTCGGAIIHPLFILTSTVCLRDFEHIYVISGYRRYISAENLHKDPCLKNMKKRIVSNFRLETDNYNPSKSSNIYKEPRWVVKDIATAKVDTPFEFHSDAYLAHCSYKPAMIRVNYWQKNEAPGSVAMALGWGHTKYYRITNDLEDHNSPTLLYTTTVITDREPCARAYTPNQDSEYYEPAVQAACLCTFAPGDVDSDGRPLHLNDTNENKSIEDAISSRRRSSGVNSTNTQQDITHGRSNFEDGNATHNAKQDDTVQPLTRRKIVLNVTKEIEEVLPLITPVIRTLKTNGTQKDTTKAGENDTVISATTAADTTTKEPWEELPWSMTGKPDLGPGLGNGICQNDHGGPLVAWIDGQERVIGVATAFKVTKKMECKGPFLFASTTYASQLIMCTVSRKERRSLGCNGAELKKQGLRIYEKLVSWEGYSDASKTVVNDFGEDDYKFLDDWYGGQ